MTQGGGGELQGRAGILCEFCNEEFPSKTKLFRHLAVHGVESKSLKPSKVVLLIGWQAPTSAADSNEYISDQEWNCLVGDTTSNAVEQAVFRAVHIVENNLSSVEDIAGKPVDRPKGFSRGASCMQRTSALFGTEPTCHGLCDTYCFHIRPLGAKSVDDWVSAVNSHLPSCVRILHGYELSSEAASSFQAETECSQRRYEYLIPLRAILPDDWLTQPEEPIVRKSKFRTAQALSAATEANAHLMDIKFPLESAEGQRRIAFFRKFKEIGKSLTGRHHFHNYTIAGAAPNDSTTVRRLDRVYHKNLFLLQNEPWVVWSLSGDSLIRGQVRKVLGMLLAVVWEFVPMDYLLASLQEDVVCEVPSLPGWGLYLAECRYANWEACYPLQRVDPRRQLGEKESDAMATWNAGLHAHIAQSAAQVFPENFLETFRQQCVAMLDRQTRIATLRARSVQCLQTRLAQGFGLSLDLVQQLNENHLASSEEAGVEEEKKADKQPADMIVSRTTPEAFQALHTSLSFLEVPLAHEDCPALYARVLSLLRAADRSTYWPASSTARQAVVSSSSLVEKGGRGGSFTVGVLPAPLAPPKGNDLFPELMHACFRLERALCPHRPPSSTIAINRHAQFQPHRDSGVGQGQTESLIVGLGAYVGGEVVVDHVVHDVRYRPLEFDGWKSMHYTLPFQGERYSLVWFTPRGVTQQDLWWWNE